MTSLIRTGVRIPASPTLVARLVGGLVLGLLAPTLLAAGASAATTPTTTKAPSGAVQNFCSQVRASQTSIASTTGTAAEKNKRIGIEWGKIEKVSPASVKSQVTIIKVAYTKASTESDVAATATLAGIASAGQKVTAFVSSSCTAGGTTGGGSRDGGGGPGRLDPARLAEIRACFEKEGVTFPEFGAPGGGRPANATPGTGSRPAGGAASVQDPKFVAAAQKCGFGGGGTGGPGGPGGFGGRGLTDAVRKCVAAKGITLPAAGQGAPGGANGATPTTKKGAAPVSAPARRAGRVQFDAKTQAAIEACRTANPA